MRVYRAPQVRHECYRWIPSPLICSWTFHPCSNNMWQERKPTRQIVTEDPRRYDLAVWCKKVLQLGLSPRLGHAAHVEVSSLDGLAARAGVRNLITETTIKTKIKKKKDRSERTTTQPEPWTNGEKKMNCFSLPWWSCSGFEHRWVERSPSRRPPPGGSWRNRIPNSDLEFTGQTIVHWKVIHSAGLGDPFSYRQQLDIF